MLKRISAILLAIAIAMAFSACGRNTTKSVYNTDSVKKFVQNSKKNGKMSYEKTKKAYKSVFPKMKMK